MWKNSKLFQGLFPTISLSCQQGFCLKMSFLEKIRGYMEEQRAPGFYVDANQVKILYEPSHFHETLLQKIKTAERRIFIASLYIGTGRLEQEFVSAINERLEEKPGLSVHVLLDCMRGSRGQVNSRTLLLPLIQNHSKAVKVSLYQTPKCRGILKRLVPDRYNEIIGLQHMKLYLFDDDLIITGANLSTDYFTNRQDRYVVINNCKPLGDFASGLGSKVSDFSFFLDERNNLRMNPEWPEHPTEGSLWDFVCKAKDHITYFYSTSACSSRKDTTIKDTVIYPMLEMGQLCIHQESYITKQIIELCPKESEVRIATSYFNMTKEYAHSIIVRCQARFKILMAHPSANGFFNAKGPAGGIPKGYSELAGRFWDKIQYENQAHRVHMLEYSRNNWTFHAKGLWCSLKPEDPPLITLIGSPNFGERSVNHDLECQFLIATTNPKLQEDLKQEYNRLSSFGAPYSSTERKRKPPLWVKIVLFLFKSYF